MADLIAQGPERRERWRRHLAPNTTIRLGRAADTWAVPWDNRISRYHARLTWADGLLQVEAEPGSTNPLFFGGEPTRQFTLRPSEHFVIGSTSFSLVDEAARVTIDAPLPISQQTFSPEYLRQVAFRHARKQIEALTQLPEVVSGATTDQELYVRLVNLLLTGTSMAKAVAVVRVAPEELDAGEIEVLHWDQSEESSAEFQPSAQLIRDAFLQRQSVLHTWHRTAPSESFGEEFDWACCTPVPGVSCEGWAIYLAGYAEDDDKRPYQPEDFEDALKIVELVATTVGSVCDVRLLQRRSTSLAHFFSPPVRDALATSDPEVALSPREADVSVLFCDLRGFSRKSEQARDDLFGLLQRVSESLGIMTRQILDHGGVIGDFHGDSAMGFWGWPLPQSDSVLSACRAALEIRSAFQSASAGGHDALSGFRVGMGLATVRAVAGKIGTIDQVKVTVFGPVVNVASRLENLTRQVGTAILIDGATADVVRSHQYENGFQLRSLAQIRPYGMQSAVDVFQLIPFGNADLDTLRLNGKLHEHAVGEFRAGNWAEAKQLLENLPDNEAACGYFLRFMQQHGFQPPADWDGVIPASSK